MKRLISVLENISDPLGRITPDDYTENKLRYDQEISRVKQQIERLEEADKSFYATASYLLQLFKHGEKIFEVASIEEKRELLKLVLSNLALKGKTVRFTPNEPFATVLKLSERSTWQGLKDDYQTYRELNSLQGDCGNMILLEYYLRDFT